MTRRRARKYRHITSLLIGMCVLVTLIPAQAQTDPAWGNPVHAPLVQTAARTLTVNAANLDFHFTVPIVAKPGRGVPFTYGLTYNSDTANTIGAVPVIAGWMATGTVSGGMVNYNTSFRWCTYYNPYNHQGQQIEYVVYSGFQYVDVSGTTHFFPSAETNTGNPCETASPSATAESAHGWKIVITNDTSAEVIGPNGWQFLGPKGPTEDAN